MLINGYQQHQEKEDKPIYLGDLYDCIAPFTLLKIVKDKKELDSAPVDSVVIKIQQKFYPGHEDTIIQPYLEITIQ